jgi:hypothetical protein
MNCIGGCRVKHWSATTHLTFKQSSDNGGQLGFHRGPGDCRSPAGVCQSSLVAWEWALATTSKAGFAGRDNQKLAFSAVANKMGLFLFGWLILRTFLDGVHMAAAAPGDLPLVAVHSALYPAPRSPPHSLAVNHW